MATVKIGDSFPEGTTFSYVPYTEEKSDITSCGVPQNYNASKEFADKKVVLFAVPGAFTPGCSVRHLPGFISALKDIKAKGVDIVAVIAFNDAFVMSAWSKANGVKNDELVRSDLCGYGRAIGLTAHVDTKFSKQLGWTMGERTARYALIIDHGKIVYAGKEDSPGEVTVSGAEAVLAKL